MRTTQEAIKNGFKLVASKENGIDVYAKLTEYKDCVQFVHCKGDACIDNVEVKTLNTLLLHKIIYDELMKGNKF